MITLNKIKVKLNFIKVLMMRRLKQCDLGIDCANAGEVENRIFSVAGILFFDLYYER